MNNQGKFFSARNVTALAILLAIVVLFQTVLGSIRIGVTSFSLVLIPIVLGSILISPFAGAFLGFVFGVIVLVFGITGQDAFTNFLFANHPVLTTLTCLVKGVAAGFMPGLIYGLLNKKHGFLAVCISSASAPILNTGIFVIFAFIMSDSMSVLADGTSVVYFIMIVCVGVNFLVEFLINVLVAPSLYSVINVLNKRRG